MKTTPLVLASASPRRQEHLRRLGLTFTLHPTAVDETPRPTEPPAQAALRLGRAKALAVPAGDTQIVIAADTVVDLAGRILGKPADPEEARRMLMALRGRDHLVHTSLALRRGEDLWAETVSARVWMRPYNEEEIECYVNSGRPLDKAGAYGIQDRPFSPAERVEGCYMTVVGLPLCHLARALRGLGVAVPRLPMEGCRALIGRPCPVALF